MLSQVPGVSSEFCPPLKTDSNLVFHTAISLSKMVGDNYSNLYDGTGDVGANANDMRNWRVNLNNRHHFQG